MKIFDRWGNLVFKSNHAEDDYWDGTLNGRELPIDSYHYIIELNNGDQPITGNVTIVR
jgi:gliding motility-associated-like protein